MFILVQHSRHPLSNVYDNLIFGTGNRNNRHFYPRDNLGPHFNNQQEQFRTVNVWFMPRPEFPKFDGNPLKITFVNGF